jgi:hypothetical protein
MGASWFKKPVKNPGDRPRADTIKDRSNRPGAPASWGCGGRGGPGPTRVILHNFDRGALRAPRELTRLNSISGQKSPGPGRGEKP